MMIICLIINIYLKQNDLLICYFQIIKLIIQYLILFYGLVLRVGCLLNHDDHNEAEDPGSCLACGKNLTDHNITTEQPY